MMADILQQPRNQSQLAFSQTAPLGESRSSQRKAPEWRDVGIRGGDRVPVGFCQIQSVLLLPRLDTYEARGLHIDLADTTTSNQRRQSAFNPPDASNATPESKQALSINALGTVCDIKTGVKVLKNGELKTEPTL